MAEPTYDPNRPIPTLEIVFKHKLVDIENKTILHLLVKFPPNGSTPPHRHGGANVVGYVLKGKVQNKMNDDPMKEIEEGGSWFEAPGCHHRISNNASKTEEATIMATMITDTDKYERDGMAALIQFDEGYLKDNKSCS